MSKPVFKAVLLDISAHCEQAFLDRCGGKVYVSGFYNDSENTYCCEARPSIWFEALELVPETFPEDETASDDLHQELLEMVSSDDCGYYHRGHIENLAVEHPERVKDLDLDLDLDLQGQDLLDAVRESLQGNPVF